jgi:predicted HTH transcriptional regulator
MSVTPEQLDLWRTAPSESQNLEFKEAKTQFSQDKLCRYCVAIANEGGGHLVLGVGDSLPRPVVGTSAYPNVLETAEKLFSVLGFRVEVQEVMHRNGRVVVFRVPSRPRGTAYDYQGTYLMRSGASLVPMSEDRLRGIFAEGEPDWLEQVSRADVSAADVVDLLDTQTFFELLNLPYPTTQTAVIDRLLGERLIERNGHGYNILRIGALLLAKQLRAFTDIALKAPRVVVYNGRSKVETRLDQIGTKGYAVGFQGLVGFVQSQLPQNEIIEDALRREVKLVPEIALRELVANALIHQDFRVEGMSVMIEVYDNRVEISNPGEPIVPVERFIDGYQSRNERMADLMRRFSICEEKSSGIDKVISAVEGFQLPPPDFQSSFRRTVVIIYGPRSFEKMDRAELDFGIYRIMNVKRREIVRYIDEDLLPQVEEVLASVQNESVQSTKEELAKLEEQLKGGGCGSVLLTEGAGAPRTPGVYGNQYRQVWADSGTVSWRGTVSAAELFRAWMLETVNSVAAGIGPGHNA